MAFRPIDDLFAPALARPYTFPILVVTIIYFWEIGAPIVNFIESRRNMDPQISDKEASFAAAGNLLQLLCFGRLDLEQN
jgi:hypothetical protein